MSALAGLVRFNGNAAVPDRLREAAAMLSGNETAKPHCWSDQNAVLAQYATEDAWSGGPFSKHDSGCVCVADAVIDNRTELINALQPSKGHAASDSDLILAAYARWGESCVDHLLGDFAFAIWDSAHQVLFLARDHFGVRPLYFAHPDNQTVAFASSPAALSRGAFLNRKLNEAHLADFMIGLDDDPFATFYSGVSSLPAGHFLVAGRNGISVRRYWRPEQQDALVLASDGQYEEAFREVFGAAVECRVSDRESTGIMLSGGIDSSSIAAVAGEQHPNLSLFSVLAQDKSGRMEGRCIDAVLMQTGLRGHTINAEKLADFLPAIEASVLESDGPEEALVPIIYKLMFALGATKGMRSMLDGVDGDFTLSPSPFKSLPILLRRGKWGAARSLAAALANHKNSSAWRMLLGKGVKPLLNSALAHRNFPVVDALIDPDFSRRYDLPERLSSTLASQSNTHSSIVDMQLERLRSSAIARELGALSRAGRHVGVEVRHPFFDKRLVEFCLSLPLDQAIQGGWAKSILRRSMVGLLPPEICWRKDRSNVSNSCLHAFMQYEQNILDDFIASELDAAATYLDVAEVRSTYQSSKQQAALPGLLQVWEKVVLASWLNRSGLMA